MATTEPSPPARINLHQGWEAELGGDPTPTPYIQTYRGTGIHTPQKLALQLPFCPPQVNLLASVNGF